MDYKEIKSQQKRILTQIDDCDESYEVNESGLLHKLSDYKTEIIQDALGNFGLRLSNFAAEVDFSHPDIISIYDEVFGDEDFKLDILNILDIASTNEFRPFVLKYLSRIITNHSRYKDLSERIDAPSKNLRHVRFAKEEIRREIREEKRIQDVSFRILMKKSKDSWDENPKDFSSYIRGFNRLAPLVEEATAQYHRFENFGLTSLACEIKSQLFDLVTKSKDDSYYGFNQITMITSSIILGRMYDAIIYTNQPDSWINKTYQCKMKSDQFRSDDHHNFPLDFCEYKPTFIPSVKMKSVPSDMISVMKKLDNWPEACGKPIFDNFWVMLPDINLELIYDLIEDEKVVGVLLGEKDDDIYFVSYWM